MQFKQGDKAICTLTDSAVEIEHGPFRTVAGKESFLVKWVDGVDKTMCSVVWVKDLKPAPRFEVEQKVTFNYSPKGESFELVAGPFPADSTDTFWVVKDEDGLFDQGWERYMLPMV